MNGAGKGFIISIEGLDQSGKRTQTRRLVARLKKNGFPVENLSFPDYSTVIGREIEAFLAGERTYNPETRHMLLSLNRWERKDDLDRWLSEGKVVVLNRYSGSNYAYGSANGLALDWLMNLEKGLPQPDLTILLDVSPRVSLKRKATGRDFHERDQKFLRRVRKEYLKLAEQWIWSVIEGDVALEKVHADMWRIVKERLDASSR